MPPNKGGRVDRVRLATALPVLKVQMHCPRRAGITHRPDHLTGLHALPALHEDMIHVSVVELAAA